MRSLHTVLAALPLSLLLACPPVDPETEPPVMSAVALRSGEWQLDIVDASLDGRCSDLTLRDVLSTEFDARIDVRRDGRATVVLDGVRLRGGYDGRLLEVAGHVDMGVGEPEPEDDRPDEDTDTDTDTDTGYGEDTETGSETDADSDASEDGDDDTDAPAPPDAAPEDRFPIEISLAAEALDARRIEGTLEVDYDMPDMRCVVKAQVEGRFLGAHEPDEPVVVVGEDEEGEEGDCPDDVDCG